MVRQLKPRNTITIPKPILEHVHVKPGDYFEIEDDGHRIILIPKVFDDPFTDDEWEKIGKLANQKGKVYSSGKSFLRSLRKISKNK